MRRRHTGLKVNVVNNSAVINFFYDDVYFYKFTFTLIKCNREYSFVIDVVFHGELNCQAMKYEIPNSNYTVKLPHIPSVGISSGAQNFGRDLVAEGSIIVVMEIVKDIAKNLYMANIIPLYLPKDLDQAHLWLA